MAGKCDSRRHCTTSFNENVVDYRRPGREKVIKFQIEVFKSFLRPGVGMAKPSPIKLTTLFFQVKTSTMNRTFRVEYFREFGKKLPVKSFTRSRLRPRAQI